MRTLAGTPCAFIPREALRQMGRFSRRLHSLAAIFRRKRPQLIAEDPITFDVIWRRMHILKPLAVASLVGLAAASSEELPHDHQGKLSKYELGPPKIFLSGDDLAQLREGRPVMQAAQQAGSSARRMVMVQDIKAPGSVVLGCVAGHSRQAEQRARSSRERERGWRLCLVRASGAP